MNPYAGYPFDYPQPGPYGWYPPYYPQPHDYPPPYYNYGMYGPQMGYYPPHPHPYDCNKTGNTPTQIIKLEEESEEPKATKSSSEKISRKKPIKVLKKKKIDPRLMRGDENIYAHPPKHVLHKVRYFDPSAAPVVSTASYNLVEDVEKQIKRNEKLYQIPEEEVDELDFPEQYDNPFIVFKFRRIKKKFKKYIKPKDEQYFGQKADESDSANDQQNSSEEEQSQSEQQKSQQPSKEKPKEALKKIKLNQPGIKRRPSDSQYLIE